MSRVCSAHADWNACFRSCQLPWASTTMLGQQLVVCITPAFKLSASSLESEFWSLVGVFVKPLRCRECCTAHTKAHSVFLSCREADCTPSSEGEARCLLQYHPRSVPRHAPNRGCAYPSRMLAAQHVCTSPAKSCLVCNKRRGVNDSRSEAQHAQAQHLSMI